MNDLYPTVSTLFGGYFDGPYDIESAAFIGFSYTIESSYYMVIFSKIVNSFRPDVAYMGRKLTIIVSDNGLLPGLGKANIWTNVGMLLIGPMGINFSEISIEIDKFSSIENPFENIVW